MKIPKIPVNEKDRQNALNSYNILDTLPEKEYDDITFLATQICKTPIALISLIDNDRQWFKSKHGIDVQETPRTVSFCAHAINEPENIFYIKDTSKDIRFADNPFVTNEPKVKFYAGAPIIDDNGYPLGTLCVIDNKENSLNKEQRESLEALSRQVMIHLKLRKVNNQLVAQNKIKELVTENSSDIIALHDFDSTFQYVSPACFTLLGYQPDELISVSAFDIIHPEDIDLLKSTAFNRLQNGENVTNIEFRFRKKDGKYIWVESTAKPIMQDGKFNSFQSSSRDISHRKNLESRFQAIREKISEKDEILQLVLNSMSDGVVVTDIHGNFIIYNTSSARILGKSKIDTSPENWSEVYDVLDPDTKKIFPASKLPLYLALSQGIESERELLIHNKSRNELLNIVVKASPIFISQDTQIGAIAVFTDITKEIQSRELLNKKQFELMAMVEAAPAALAMFDKDIKYIAASDHWYSSYGLNGIEIIGRSHYEIFPEIGDDWKQVHQRALNGAIEKRDEDKFERLDGSVTWLKWDVRPWFDINGEIGGILMLTENITERKYKEDELRIAKIKAEEAVLAKNNFLSNVSHEIRTPLNAIIGLTDLILQESPRDDQLDYLKIISFSGKNLLSLINDILDYNKIEAGKITLDKAEFNLKSLLSTIIQAHEFKSKENGNTIKLFFDDQLPEYILHDEVRLSQIFNNLLSNAIKFTENGTIKLIADVKRLEGNEVDVLFEVIDTGIGINEKKLKLIFDRFEQAEANTTRRFGGTGLGLSITKHLLDLMGSSIQVESKEGKGSKFYFTLTLTRSKKKPNAAHGTAGNHIVSLKEFNIKLLLVEDNKANQLVSSAFLKKWGIKIDFANNGIEAFNMISQQKYDIILMDIHMPKLDGYQATKKIRDLDDPYYKTVPILALTASAMAEQTSKAIELGMNDVILKPFVAFDLYSKIVKNLKITPSDKIVEVPEGINFINELAGDDMTLKNEILYSFIQNIKELRDDIHKALIEKDINTGKFIIHKTKFTLDKINNQSLLNLTKIAAEKLENEDFTGSIEFVNTFQKECNDIIDMLNNLLSN